MKYFFTRASLLLVALLVLSATAVAQFTVTGNVQDSDGEPLIGVSILVKGTATGTVTDFDGNYSINARGQSAVLEFSYTGFKPQSVAVNPNSGTVNVVLEDDIANLEAVVVTGLASSIKRSNLANSVATISSKELTGVSVPTTTDAALYGKFKGANITSNSGAPGGGIGIKLRGTTSIGGSSQPLFIIDGVYIDNSSVAAGLNIVSAAAGGGSSTFNQENPSNRLADIDPNDIESIEILKGASAAAIYGSRAAGGVVIITTKRGEAGKTKVHLAQSVGWTEILNPLGVREWTEERVLNSRWASQIDLFRTAQANGTIQNYEDLLYGNKGMLLNTRLSASGGNDKTKFFIGGTFKDEEGIVTNTGYEKQAVRINLDHTFNDWFDASLSSNYVHSSSDRGFFNNDNSGTTMGVAFSSTPGFAQLLPDENGNYPSNPFAGSNFLETAERITNNEKVNRFIGGLTLTAKLLQTENTLLRFMIRGGIDTYSLATTAIFPNSVQFQRDGNGLNGVSVQGNTNNLNTNLAAFLVWSQFLDNGLTFRTQLGVTQENFDRNTILGTASNLIGSQTNLDQSGSRNLSQNRLIQEDKGVFIQEEVNWEDKIIATVGLRADKSSNNGDPNELFYYPKASAAINLHKFDFLSSNTLSQLKLRVAYGQSGNFAVFGDKFTSLNGVVVDGRPGAVIGLQKGNAQVGPERQTELEFGFDLGLLNDKLLLDVTYYNKSVDDLLLQADVPTSSGFQAEVVNAAALENKGVEIGLSANIVNGQDFQWYSRVGWWKNKAEVTELLIPSFTDVGFSVGLGTFRIKEGRSPTEIISVGPADLQDEEGVVVFGDAEPDFQMSFYNELSYKNFDLSFILHWKNGGQNINLSSLLFDDGETTHDFDDTDIAGDGVTPNGVARLNSIGTANHAYIQDAGYVRLREIGLYYTLPQSVFQDVLKLKLGFSGTNLLNFFDYDSYDPEVSNFGSGGLSPGVEVTPFPSSKRFNFHIIADF